MQFVNALSHIIDNIVFSHGYTLSVWSAGMLAIRRYGSPKVRDVILFLEGAIFAYSILGVPVLFDTAQKSLLHTGASILELAPLTSAILSALTTRAIGNREAGYFTTGVVNTFVYVVVLALLLSYMMP